MASLAVADVVILNPDDEHGAPLFEGPGWRLDDDAVPPGDYAALVNGQAAVVTVVAQCFDQFCIGVPGEDHAADPNEHGDNTGATWTRAPGGERRNLRAHDGE